MGYLLKFRYHNLYRYFNVNEAFSCPAIINVAVYFYLTLWLVYVQQLFSLPDI